MAAPSAGVTWVNSGLAVLVRDFAGSATDLSPGATSYFQGKPASKPFVERQLILIRSDRAGGLEELTAEPYPRAALKDVGEAVMDKKNADAPVPPRRHRGIAGRARKAAAS
jgi:hypothetical protein